MCSFPLSAKSVDPSIDYQKRLADGEVIVGLKNQGPTRFVTGTILINEPPERVWRDYGQPIRVSRQDFATYEDR